MHPPDRRVFLGAAGAAAAGLTADDPPLAPPDKQPPHLKLPEPPARKLGYAVVGIGQLALEEVLPAFALCKHSRVTALVSGHPDKAKKVAAAYGVPAKAIYGYDTFDRLADDRTVDVVYVILPNTMHAEFTVRGLKAGKHVLCEKPMAPTVAECERMIAAGKEARRSLMIAYRLHYEPFNLAAMDLCRAKKALGKVKQIVASNGQDTKAPNIRLSRELAGGPLGDVGVYCLNAARYLTGEEPAEVTGLEQRPADDPRFREVPEGVSWTMRFPGGAVAVCDCSFGIAEARRYAVHGSEATLELENAFAYRGQRLFLRKGERRELKIEPVNHFAAEMDDFSKRIVEGKPPRTPGEEGLADVRAIKAIEEAARTGKTVKVG